MQPSKQQISTNNLIAILSVVTLLVVIVCGLFANNLYHSLTLNNRVIAKKKVAAETSKQNLTNYQTLHDKFQTLGGSVVSAEDSLPTTPDFTAIASIMERVAGRSGGTLKSVSQDSAGTSDANSVGKAVAVPYNFTYEGSYDSVRRLWTAIELSSRPLSVKTVNISGNNSDMKIDVSMKSYYQPSADVTSTTEVVK